MNRLLYNQSNKWCVHLNTDVDLQTPPCRLVAMSPCRHVALSCPVLPPNRCLQHKVFFLRVSLRQGKAPAAGSGGGGRPAGRLGLPPIVVNLNSSSSELKLLRVLQTLVNLSGKDAGELHVADFDAAEGHVLWRFGHLRSIYIPG